MPPILHVNGVAEIKVGTATAGALELLGHSLDGVTIDPQYIEDPVFSDAGGGPGGVPVTFIKQGQIDIISADIHVSDEAVLAKIRKGTETILAGAAEGVMTKAGLILDNTLVGGSGVGGYHRLLILSPDDQTPRNYLTARLMRDPVRRSTKEMVWRLQWKAIPYIGPANTMAGAVLWNSVTT
jgi:hypothetical protein